jgi:hypothetical protein
MFKKIWNKPWTWGTYFKLTGVSMLLSVGFWVLAWLVSKRRGW